MYPVLGELASQMLAICALLLSLTGHLPMAVVGSDFFSVELSPQTLSFLHSRLMDIRSVVLSSPLFGTTPDSRIFDGGILSLLWAEYSPFLSLLDTFNPYKSIIICLITTLLVLFVAFVLPFLDEIQQLRKVSASQCSELNRMSQALEARKADIRACRQAIVQLCADQDDLADVRDDMLTDLERMRDSIEAQFDSRFALNCEREKTIENLEEEIRRCGPIYDGLLGDYVLLGRYADTQAESSINSELERQAELSDLDERDSALHDETQELQDRVQQQSQEAANLAECRAQEIVRLLTQLENVETELEAANDLAQAQSSDLANLENTLRLRQSEKSDLLFQQQILQHRLAEQDHRASHMAEVHCLELAATQTRLQEAKDELSRTQDFLDQQTAESQSLSIALSDAIQRNVILRSENEDVQQQLEALAEHRQHLQTQRDCEASVFQHKMLDVQRKTADTEDIADIQANDIRELRASLHESDNAAHYAQQIYDGELLDAARTLDDLRAGLASQHTLHHDLVAAHGHLQALHTAALERVSSLQTRLARLTEVQQNEQAELLGQVSRERQMHEKKLSERRQVLATRQLEHDNLKASNTLVTAENTALLDALLTARDQLSSSIDAARAEISAKQQAREAGHLKLTTEIEKHQAKIQELTDTCGALEVDNTSLAQQLAESQQEVSELKIWHQEQETKREKDQLEYQAQCMEMFRQIAASKESQIQAEERAQVAERAAEAAIQDLEASQASFITQLAAVRSQNVVAKTENKELLAEHQDLQERLVSQQMAHYSQVDALMDRTRVAELGAKKQQPLRTPAIRQREAQIASLEETIDLLMLTDSAMKEMVAQEVVAREAAEQKLRSIQATIKYIDSPSLHGSPTPTLGDISMSSGTPSLVDTSGNFSRSFSASPEPETPGTVLFDADNLGASGSCDIVDSATVTCLSSGLGLGLELELEM